MFFVIVDLI
jgi:hypothetical protein